MSNGTLTGLATTTTAIVTTTGPVIAAALATTTCPVMATTTTTAITTTTDRVPVSCDLCHHRKKKCLKYDDDKPCSGCEKKDHKSQVRGSYQTGSYNLGQADQHRFPPSSFVPNTIVRVSSQGHQSVEGLCETGPYSSGQVDRQQFSPVSCGSPPHFYTHHSPNNFITNGFSMPMNAGMLQVNSLFDNMNVNRESSPITNTLGPPVQYPSVICPVPVLTTIYACPRSNVQVHYSCEHSVLPINGVHQSVGGLYETGSYNSDQADWQQVSPVSCGSPSHFYIHHPQNNFIRNELPMPMNEVQQNRLRDVGPITNTFGPPPVQYPSVICPVPMLMTIYACPCTNVQIQYSCEHSGLPINAIGTSQGPHQMLISSSRENNSQNSSTTVSQSKDLTVKWAYYMNRTLSHWDNANYLNMTPAPELQTSISQTPVHINEIEATTTEIITTTTSPAIAAALATTTCPVMATTTTTAIITTTDRIPVSCDLCHHRKKKCLKYDDDKPCSGCEK
ncbi:14029_t:CDS:2, partial [Gigaspora margarita]